MGRTGDNRRDCRWRPARLSYYSDNEHREAADTARLSTLLGPLERIACHIRLGGPCPEVLPGRRLVVQPDRRTGHDHIQQATAKNS